MNKRRKLRVLIADDEGAIIRIYSIGLQHYFAPDKGASVAELESEIFGQGSDSRPSAEIIVCQQGVEAVTLAREAFDAGNPFDVIVLDVRMPPGITGVQAALQIREFDPSVPVLFVSGFSDYTLTDLQAHVPPPDHMDILEKPVQLSELASKIKQITVQENDNRAG